MSHIQVDGLSAEIDGNPILEGIDLSIPRGQFVGLVGPNGSGKSTLLRAIYRVFRPWAGRVVIDDEDVWRLAAKDAARKTAVVAQERMGEFDFSVAELVLMGRTPHKGLFDSDNAEDHAIVDRCLDRVHMTELRERSFLSLSGGEKQRVLLARALAQQARFLVLDEPTNHLDIRHQLDLLRQVRGLGVTALAALHDLNLAARYCDRIVMISQGKIVADGTPDDVLTNERIATVYGVGARRIPDPDGVPQIAFFPLDEALTSEVVA